MIRSYLARLNPRRIGVNQRLLAAERALTKPQSVMFFTSHKCASSFMNQFFLLVANDSQYKVIDYASSIWALGNSLDIGADYETFLEQNYDRLYFQTGEIYTPQRKPLSFPGIEKFKHVFFLRDPRDVLVSAYYSFGFSHSVPKNLVAKEQFLQERERIKSSTIDEYAQRAAKEWILPVYEQYQALRIKSHANIFLSYDVFNSNLPKFIDELSTFLDFTPSEKDIQKIIRINTKGNSQLVDTSKHRRSGKSGQFREELSPRTIKYLNELLGDVLNYWDFKV